MGRTREVAWRSRHGAPDGSFRPRIVKIINSKGSTKFVVRPAPAPAPKVVHIICSRRDEEEEEDEDEDEDDDEDGEDDEDRDDEEEDGDYDDKKKSKEARYRQRRKAKKFMESVQKDVTSLKYFVANCDKVGDNMATLKVVGDILERATSHAEQGDGLKLVALCGVLPSVIKKSLGSERVCRHRESQVQVLKVLCTLVKFAQAVLHCKESRSADTEIHLFNVRKIMEALSAGVDSDSHFYQKRLEKRLTREIVVSTLELKKMLEIPGYFVKVAGNLNKMHYYCKTVGVNRQGKACSCCTPCEDADAIIVYIDSLLYDEDSYTGSVYRKICRLLLKPKQLPFPMIEILLRPLTKLLPYSNLEYLDNVFNDVCQGLTEFLEETIRADHQDGDPNFETVWADYDVFTCILSHLQIISYSDVIDHGTLAGLQTLVWERLIDTNRSECACTKIAETLDHLNLPRASGEFLSSADTVREWLEEQGIIRKLLEGNYEGDSVKNVNVFVADIHERELLLEEHVENLLNFDLNLEQKSIDSHELIVANILDITKICTMSKSIWEKALQWLERRQSTSVIAGQRSLHILNKFVVSDKEKKLEQRILKLFWNLNGCVPGNESADILTSVADYYDTANIITEVSIPQFEETARFLQSCSASDSERRISNNVVGAFNRKSDLATLEKEFLSNICSQSEQLLGFDIRIDHHDIAKECLQRLSFATALQTDSYALSSAVVSALTPEMHILDALAKERSFFIEAQALRSELQKEYNDLKSDKYFNQRTPPRSRKLEVKILQDFLHKYKADERIIDWYREALYQKAKVVVYMRRAKMSADNEVTVSDEFLNRILQKAGSYVKEVEGNFKQCSERLPNPECSVCFEHFSVKRKRSCVEPCGHASACFECAMKEWKRTKTCSLCKSSNQRPVPLPFKIFF